ncbi:MAG: hypothetical protein RLZZ597_2801, partial [Cyanobacteriota bacterium]
MGVIVRVMQVLSSYFWPEIHPSPQSGDDRGYPSTAGLGARGLGMLGLWPSQP